MLAMWDLSQAIAHDRRGIADVTHTLRAALDAVASTLEHEITLAQTIASIERDLAHVLRARRMSIVLGDDVRARAGDEREIVVPLVLEGRSLGSIALASDECPGEECRALLRALAAPIAVTLAWRARTSERDRLHALMRTDALTGLANRMAFDERLDSAWRRSWETHVPVALALLDIDYFKVYNDLYGHVAGDACLRDVAAMLECAAKSEGTFVARYGGEEFALIAEGTGELEAFEALERIARTFEHHPIEHRGSTLGRISWCVGIASGTPTGWTTVADFVREADRSLYRAKALGRNRICCGSYVSSGAVVSRNVHSLAGPPVFADATVGRDADLSRVVAAMRQARMISLVGPAGIGKSRLAALVGASVRQTVTDGIAYVDFSMCSSEVDPVGLVGTALDLVMESGDARAELCDAFKERHTLLILDNVAASAARPVARLCDELLAAAPELSLLVTSRAALGSIEERAVVVPPLSEAAALELLCLRSASAETTELRALARALDGNPAAIERATRSLPDPVSEQYAGRA